MINRYKRKYTEQTIQDLEKAVIIFYNDNIENSLQKLFVGNFKGINIYVVNGEYIKKAYDTDFVEGGHDLVYSFINENEIWIDNNLETDNYKYILYHEYIERYLMKNKNLTYEKAHEIATNYENTLRQKV